MRKITIFTVIALALSIASIALAADSGDKFPLKDVSVEYNSDLDMSMAQGEITNNSGKSYEAAMFKLSFYDAKGKLLGAVDVAIMDFGKGETVTFEGVGDKDMSEWETYKIRLDMSA
jgi:hypothetical protein